MFASYLICSHRSDIEMALELAARQYERDLSV